MRYTYIADPDSRELMVIHRAIGSTRDYKTIELYYYSVKKTITYPIDFISKDGILFSYRKNNYYRMFLPETHDYFNVRVMLDGVNSIGGDRFGINGPIRRKLNSIFWAVRAEYRRAKRRAKRKTK